MGAYRSWTGGESAFGAGEGPGQDLSVQVGGPHSQIGLLGGAFIITE